MNDKHSDSKFAGNTIHSFKELVDVIPKENIGENCSGKSTLLKVIAWKCGFGLVGGGKGNLLSGYEAPITLDSIIKLSWMPKVLNGFFLRLVAYEETEHYLLTKRFLNDTDGFIKSLFRG